MFPLGSASHRVKTIPVATLLLFSACAYVFYLELHEGEDFILRWSATAAGVSGGERLETIITSMFLHINWLHLGSNMLFLWGFAPLMEDVMGSVRFLIFYLLGGIAALGTHLLLGLEPESEVPLLGASGAISAVMGAFLVTYPRDKMRTFIFPIFRVFMIPAFVLILIYIGLQLFGAWYQSNNPGPGGVAYLAHIGGLVFGMLTGKLFARGH